MTDAQRAAVERLEADGWGEATLTEHRLARGAVVRVRDGQYVVISATGNVSRPTRLP